MGGVAPFVSALILAVAPQTAVAEEPAAIHTLLDLSFSECHNPRALAVGSTGWIYAAGLSVNVCGIAPWGQLMGVIPVPPGPAGVAEGFGALYQAPPARSPTGKGPSRASPAAPPPAGRPRPAAPRPP